MSYFKVDKLIHILAGFLVSFFLLQLGGKPLGVLAIVWIVSITLEWIQTLIKAAKQPLSKEETLGSLLDHLAVLGGFLVAAILQGLMVYYMELVRIICSGSPI